MSFDSGSTTEKFPAGQQQIVTFILHNFGKELGEKINTSIYFPNEFGVLAVPVSPIQFPTVVHTQPSSPVSNYPGRLTASTEIRDLHEDMAVTVQVNLTMPATPGTYKVPADIWECRLGKSKQDLTFEVTPSAVQAASQRATP